MKRTVKRLLRSLAPGWATALLSARARGGFCDPSWLMRNLSEGAFLLSDCEGYEGELFAREGVPQLRTATLIVETHEELVPGVTGRIREKLSASHAVHAIDSGSGRRTSSRELLFLSEKERDFANLEVRNPQTWLLGLPGSGPNASLREKAAALFPRMSVSGARDERGT